MHDSQRLAGFLQALQNTNSCEGFESLAQHSRSRNRRTLYRWRRLFGESLQIVPSFSLERLGLEHLHLVITKPSRAWLRFPYAVEHAWLTADFAEDALYLHCIVPSAHKGFLRGLLRECQHQGWCTRVSASWSGAGWQELPEASNGSVPLDLPVSDDAGVLREYPFVVPAIFESWDHPQSLASIWNAAIDHIGDRLRSYVPRGRIYHVNGKMHVRQAYAVLSKQGFFRQYLIRYDGWLTESLEVFVFLQHAGDWLAELCEALRNEAVAMETYHGNDGAAVLRVVGREGVLRQVLGVQEELRAHGATIFLRNAQHEKQGQVRFCYELLFDPKTREWVFPHNAIMTRMGTSK